MALSYSFHWSTVFEIFAVEFDISESIHSFFHIPNRNHVGLEMETSRFVLFFEFSYLPPLIDILRRIDSFDFTTSLWETLEGKNKFDKALSFASPYALFRGRGTTDHLDTVVKLHVCSECCQPTNVGIFRNIFSLGTHHQSYFSTASCAQILSNGTEEGSKEIDFEFLFQSCTKIHLAKRLHALLIVSGKAQSIFISTRVVNLYANLGDVTHSRCTFDQIPKEDMPIPGI